MIFDLDGIRHAWPAFGHLWTISVEEQFYIVFPLLFFGLNRKAFPLIILPLILAGPFIRAGFVSYLLHNGYSNPSQLAFAVYASSFGQFDAFLMGALLAHYEERLRNRPVMSVRLAGAASVLLFSYCVGYVLVNHYVRGAAGMQMFRWVVSGTLFGQGREILLYGVIDAAAAAVVALAIVEWPGLRLIASRSLSAIGRISYGGYLYHALLLLLINDLILHGAARYFSVPIRIEVFSVIWIGTVLIAWCSYQWIERRAMKVGHQISARLLASATPILVSEPSIEAGPAA
jgi:peptidoglycan/LPS O-acetylase OafA/YrhL